MHFWYKEFTFQPDYVYWLHNKSSNENILKDSRQGTYSNLCTYCDDDFYTNFNLNQDFNNLQRYSDVEEGISTYDVIKTQTDLSIVFFIGNTKIKDNKIAFLDFIFMDANGDIEIFVNNQIIGDIRRLNIGGMYFDTVSLEFIDNKTTMISIIFEKLNNVKIYRDLELIDTKNLNSNALEGDLELYIEKDWDAYNFVSSRNAYIRNVEIYKQKLTENNLLEIYNKNIIKKKDDITIFNGLMLFSSAYSNADFEFSRFGNIYYYPKSHNLGLRATNILAFNISTNNIKTYNDKVIFNTYIYAKQSFNNINIGFFELDSENYIRLYFENGQYLEHNINIDIDTWYKLTAYYELDKNKVSLYINNIKVEEFSYIGDRSIPKNINQIRLLDEDVLYIKKTAYLLPSNNYSIDTFLKQMDLIGEDINQQTAIGGAKNDTFAYATAKSYRTVKADAKEIIVNSEAINTNYRVVLLIDNRLTKDIEIDTYLLGNAIKRTNGIKTTNEPHLIRVNNIYLSDNIIRSNINDVENLIEANFNELNRDRQLVYQTKTNKKTFTLYGNYIEKRICDIFLEAIGYKLIIEFSSGVSYDIEVIKATAIQIAEGIDMYKLRVDANIIAAI